MTRPLAKRSAKARPPGRHPTSAEWIEWIRSGRSEPPGLAAHLARCVACRERASSLGELARHDDVRWALPSSDVLDRTLRGLEESARREETAPARGRRRKSLDWIPADVRTSALAPELAPRVVSRRVGSARVSLYAAPIPGEPAWSVRGRVWLDEPQGDIRVFLVHRDHVAALARIASGGTFHFEEPVPSGWSLEILLPSGEFLVLREP